MKATVILLAFGEPKDPTLEEVQAYLEGIFEANAALDGSSDPERRRGRSRQLAERRAPGLLRAYREIGGSPMMKQSEALARRLEAELHGRGLAIRVQLGTQFWEPSIGSALARARLYDPERLIALPLYPLCGPSTTIGALAALDAELKSSGWSIEPAAISGWYLHPAYVQLRADAIRNAAVEAGVRPGEGGCVLLFSAHGIPARYLEQGSRYVRYVEDCCRRVAAAVEVESYALGYQNHSNRGIPWTEPEVEQVVRELNAEHVLVDAISFMHEQSETLSELDHELRRVAESAGVTFHRVPIPHDDERFVELLADLVQTLAREPTASDPLLRRCSCCPDSAAWCVGAGR
ncbi:MAG: ferrochelatase [Gemmatimonadota bacterium]